MIHCIVRRWGNHMGCKVTPGSARGRVIVTVIKGLLL